MTVFVFSYLQFLACDNNSKRIKQRGVNEIISVYVDMCVRVCVCVRVVQLLGHVPDWSRRHLDNRCTGSIHHRRKNIAHHRYVSACSAQFHLN